MDSNRKFPTGLTGLKEIEREKETKEKKGNNHGNTEKKKQRKPQDCARLATLEIPL